MAFTVRADEQGGKRLQRLPGAEFVRRLLLHVLPTGLKRIRHYGVLASSCKGVKLTAARQALQSPEPNPAALESAQGFMARVARIDAPVSVLQAGAVAGDRNPGRLALLAGAAGRCLAAG